MTGVEAASYHGYFTRVPRVVSQSADLLPLGVTGNTPDSGSGESWFDPRRGNSKPGNDSTSLPGSCISTSTATWMRSGSVRAPALWLTSEIRAECSFIRAPTHGGVASALSMLGLRHRRAAWRRDDLSSNASCLRRTSRLRRCGAVRGRSEIMSGSGRTLATVVVAALSSWSCGSTAPDGTPAVAAIVVSPAISTLALNSQLSLQAQVQDGSGAIVPDAVITWTVQDPRIVSVSEAGVVTALAVGTSQVAANALGKSGVAAITVNPSPVPQGPANPGPANPGPANPGTATPAAVATVTVTAPSKKVEAGSTMQLTATAKDDKGNLVHHQSFFWSSSNTERATVSASGAVTAKRQGDVTITARTSPTGGKSGSLKIEVEKKEDDDDDD